MKRSPIILLLLLLLFWNPVSAAQPYVEAPVALLMDGDTGQILYEKSIDTKCYPASITKILTALIFIENVDMNEVMVVGENVPYEIEQGSSQIYLIPGEELTAEQILNALLIESANDAAVVIAEHISGSIEAFAKKMNQRAKELGATESNFVNPNGLHDENHYTTARDMGLIMREVLKHPELMEIMTRRNYIIPETLYQETRYLWTKNKLYLSTSSSFYNEDVIASKTGYTSQAGNTLVSAAAKDDLTLITVVLQCNGTMTYDSTNALFDYGFDSFSPLVLLEDNQVVESIEIGGDTLDLVAASELRYTLPSSQDPNIVQTVEISEDVELPLSKGAQVGSVVFSLDDTEIGRIGLLAAEAVAVPFSLGLFLGKALLCLLALLLAVYLILRVYVYRVNAKIRRRKLARKRKSEYAKF